MKGVAYGYKEKVCGLGRFVCDGFHWSVSEVYVCSGRVCFGLCEEVGWKEVSLLVERRRLMH